jgi:hypothetical protein
MTALYFLPQTLNCNVQPTTGLPQLENLNGFRSKSNQKRDVLKGIFRFNVHGAIDLLEGAPTVKSGYPFLEIPTYPKPLKWTFDAHPAHHSQFL